MKNKEIKPDVLMQRLENGLFKPFLPDDENICKTVQYGQVARFERLAIPQKQRSLKQLAFIHVILGKVALNARDKAYDTLDKAKFMIKVSVRFIKSIVSIGKIRCKHCNKEIIPICPECKGIIEYLQVIPRSFSYKDLKHFEANNVFDAVVNECANVLGVSPDELKQSFGDVE